MLNILCLVSHTHLSGTSSSLPFYSKKMSNKPKNMQGSHRPFNLRNDKDLGTFVHLHSFLCIIFWPVGTTITSPHNFTCRKRRLVLLINLKFTAKSTKNKTHSHSCYSTAQQPIFSRHLLVECWHVHSAMKNVQRIFRSSSATKCLLVLSPSTCTRNGTSAVALRKNKGMA